MYRYPFLRFIFFVISFALQPCFAQSDIATLFNSNAALENSFMAPSWIGNEYKSAKVSLLPVHIGVGTNFFSFGDLKDYYTFTRENNNNKTYSNATINSFLGNLKNTNIAFAGADITLLNVGVNINVKRKKMLELGFGIREHVHTAFHFNRELPELLLKGNKQFENQTIDILPKFQLMQYTDYSIVAAKSFSIHLNKKAKPIWIKPAVRLRYLVGNANITMEDMQLSMYTAPEGRFIETTLKGNVLTSGLSTDAYQNKNGTDITRSFLKGNGRGFAMDLGATVQPIERLEATISFFDNGFIRFKEDTYNLQVDEKFTWEGYDVNKPIDSLFETEDIDIDSNLASYKVGIGSKLLLSGSYGFGKKLFAKRRSYYPHNVRFVYLQGFKNYLNTSATPIVSLGYSFVHERILDIGVNATMGGNRQAGFGAHVHFAFGPFQLGVSSNSLRGLIQPYAVRDVDFKIYTALCF